MKNREKFAKEILDIACNGRSIAVTKDNKVVCCSDISCESCMFDSCGKHIGRSRVYIDRLREWTESEYVEKFTITSREKKFLDLIKEKYTYIARDKDGLLVVYTRKPEKRTTYWLVSDILNGAEHLYIKAFKVNFDFIKWEDEKPWLIEDLKKLEVREDTND